MKLTSFTSTTVVIILFVAAVVLLLASLFLSILLFPALVASIVAFTIAVQAKPAAVLYVAWLFAILAGAGFVAMFLLWGKLDYGVVLYLVAWGPFIVAACAIALFVVHYLSHN